MRHTTWAGSPDLQNMVLAAHHPQLPAQLLACCTSGCTSRPAQPSSKHAGHLFYEHARVAKGGCRFLQASSQPATVVTRQLAPGRPAHPGRLPQQPGPLTPAAAAHCTEPRPELACVHSSNPSRSSRSFHAMRMPCAVGSVRSQTSLVCIELQACANAPPVVQCGQATVSRKVASPLLCSSACRVYSVLALAAACTCQPAGECITLPPQPLLLPRPAPCRRRRPRP